MREEAVFKKADEEKQVVYAEVYVPDVPDSYGDWMTREDIEEMAWDFMRRGRQSFVDVNHDNQMYSCCVVESFVARDDDKIFIAGAWVVGVHIPSPDLWAMVKNGTLNGFSLQGMSECFDEVIEYEVQDQITGMTDEVAGDGCPPHSHAFTVSYGPDGSFLGGFCAVACNHTHDIVKGTVTGESRGHTHRFSFIDQMVIEDAP